MKFYFRFRYRPFGRNQISAYYSASGYRISSKSEHTLRKYDVISILRWRPLNSTSGFIFVDVTALRMSKSISKPNFVDNRRLRYNYFHFWKTNFCHIGILLPVSTSTISSWSACYSASGCRISSKSQHPLPKHEVISIFQMAAASHVICFGVMADHPRSAFRGLNSILK